MLLVVGLLLCAVWGVALGLSAIRMVREGWELWYVLVHVGLLAVSLLAFGAVAVSGDELSRRHAGLEEARASALESELETLRADYANLHDMYHERRGSHHFTRVTENTSHALPREQMLQVPVGRTVEPEDEGQPVAVFTKALDGMQCDWGAVQRAARSIRTPGYSLHAFHVDCRTAFPELTLYVVSRGGERKPGQSDVSSGVDAQAEYLRTMGALFAVYWLCRIGIDGERGFSFGVGDDWLPREPPPADSDVPDELKRLQFFEKQEWGGLQQLFVDAGILTRGKISGTFTPNVERVAGILVLTAIHDIMKIEALLPKVTEAQRCRADGFKPGDTINDHDLALGYVLDHWPWCLPSFAALPPAQQKSVAFTQSKMGFNHGWLVQAEAPPSALFSSFKQVIASEGVAAEDISFYFVHWVTDLAGAVPSPLEGSEKFVLKFPHPVLGSFIRSFGVLNELAYKSETQVLEDYLEQQWRENEGELGPEPAGDGAIALMRLVVQAQIADKQKAMVSAFAALKEEDRQILCDEMARTGAEGQKYARTPQNHKVGGPAFLVYYSPAFVRALAPAEAVEALRLLAEVYRRARRLWPLNAKSEGQSVTVRIDQIKELSLPEIQAIYADGDSWLLSKRNNREAVVERHPLDDMAELMRSGVSVAVLKFWTRGQGARYTRGSQLGGLPSECSDSAWGSNDTPRSRVSSITPYAYHPGPAGAGGSRPSKSPLPNTPELASAPGSAEAVAIAGAPGEASQPQLSGREGPLEC